MNSNSDDEPKWFAIRTHQALKAEKLLAPFCDEVFFPKETVKIEGKKSRVKALIPHVLFIKCTSERALQIEKESHQLSQVPIPFWIYRYPTDSKIQIISQRQIDLLQLLTTSDSSKCEIFNKTTFHEKDRVRIVGGIYQGYEGYVQRVHKNRHVVVRIEGVCAVLLPFIHPDLLQTAT